MSRRSDMHGFTLIELLITLALLTIVAGIAVPNFTAFIQKTQLQGQADDLVATLLYARGSGYPQNHSRNHRERYRTLGGTRRWRVLAGAESQPCSRADGRGRHLHYLPPEWHGDRCLGHHLPQR